MAPKSSYGLSMSSKSTNFRVTSTGHRPPRRFLTLCDKSLLTTVGIVTFAASLIIWRISRSSFLQEQAVGHRSGVQRTAIQSPEASSSSSSSHPPWRKPPSDTLNGYLYGWSVPQLAYRLGWPSMPPQKNSKTFNDLPLPRMDRVGGPLRRLGASAMAASGHTLVVSFEGRVFSVGRSWGIKRQKGEGQLGRGGRFDRVGLVGGALTKERVTGVAAGGFHSLAVTAEGKVFSWGSNRGGELGRSTRGKPSSSSPGQIRGPLASLHVTAVAAGRLYSLALTQQGHVYTWGRNNVPRGDKWQAAAGQPRRLVGPTMEERVVQVACGPQHWLALTEKGSIYSGSTGFTIDGEHMTPPLGSALLSEEDLFVFELEGHRAVSVAATANFSYAVTEDGSVYEWDREGPAVGPGQVSESRAVWHPKRVDSPALNGVKVVELAASETFTLARSDDGRVFSWGDNSFHQLGRSAPEFDPIPNEVDNLADFKVIKVAAGYKHGLVLCVPKHGKESVLEHGEKEDDFSPSREKAASI